MAAELNRLSCVRCKDRKIRCSRVMPTCDRCKTQGAECVYPVRQKRKVNKPQLDQPAVPSDALSTILERLQRVEEQCTALPQDDQPPEEHGPSPAYTPRSAPSIASRPYSVAPSPAASTGTQLAPLRPWRHTPITPASSLPTRATDATAVLKEAMDAVQKSRLQSFSTSVITEEIDIPRDLALSWIRGYFSQKPTDMFLSLLDRKFVEMIPDMMRYPHVHLDSCVLIIYYGVLWHGCSIYTDRANDACARKWTRLTYIACLRALPGWQRGATGTITDLIAAITMARVYGENFDYELAWKMFKLAGEYAQGLGMHNLDGEGGMMDGVRNPNISDENRKSFWDLVQVDIFFRLMYNKPPSLTGNAWNVNLPWLNSDSQSQPDTLTTRIFLVSSRVTFILISFFSMLERSEGDAAQMMRQTEDMCLEIKRIYDEWSITDRVKAITAAPLDAYVVADLALNGYTCIIFMLRKMAALDTTSPQPIATDTDVPDSPIALEAARHLVDITGWLLAKYPNVSTLSATFGAYRAHVAYAYLVSHILRTRDVMGGGSWASDIASLERVGRCVADIATVERDFTPLAKAMRALNDEIQRKVGGGGGGG